MQLLAELAELEHVSDDEQPTPPRIDFRQARERGAQRGRVGVIRFVDERSSLGQSENLATVKRRLDGREAASKIVERELEQQCPGGRGRDVLRVVSAEDR